MKSLIAKLTLPDNAIEYQGDYYIPSDKRMPTTCEIEIIRNPDIKVEFYPYSYQRLEQNWYGRWYPETCWIGMHHSMHMKKNAEHLAKLTGLMDITG